IASLWRSNVTNCIRYSPKTDFWSFFGINLLSGGAAGAFSLTFVYPLDYARTRLASDVGSGKKTFTGLGDCLVKTAKGPKGILGLYQGFGISVAGIIPYRGVQFGFNDTLKGLNPWDKEVSFRGIVSKSLGAQLSVILSGFVTYPFDTIRRRLQMEAVKPSNEKLYRGALHCFSRIVKEEGAAALFKGAGANILRGTGAALVLVFYGEAQAFMAKK
ncbi:hypothetical protein HK099_008473, partial [Clydaea vesicula]